MLTTTTHNKLREALDGTDTQVATRNRQMDGQNEENRMIYNQGDFTKKGTAIRKTPESSIGGVSEKEKKKSSSAEDRGRALTFPPTTL